MAAICGDDFDTVVITNVTKVSKKQLKQIAKAKDMTLSGYLRSVLHGEIKTHAHLIPKD